MNDQVLNKICGVCGHKAIGKNFGAISCEPCKAFFRRNAMKSDLKCYFEGKCDINLITRKFCSKCRLEKCLTIGMRKEWILNEEEKGWRRMKSKATKSKAKAITDCESSRDSSTSDKNDQVNISYIDNIIFDNNFSVDELNTEIMEIENCVPNDPEINKLIQCFDENDIKDTQKVENIFIDENNVISNAVFNKAVEFELSVIPIARPIPESSDRFNDTEIRILAELINSTRIIGQPLARITSEITNIPELNRTVSMKFDRGVRNVVKASKTLSAFQCLCENDKISLLKHGVIQALLVRSVFFYNFPQEYWTLALDNDNSVLLKLELLKNIEIDIYTAYKRYYHKIQSLWDSDSTIIDLLMAIILFNPDRPYLINKDVVKLNQHIYLHLLKRYLLMKYGSECEAKSRLLRLMNATMDLNVLREMQKRTALNNDPKDMGPLLKEIYDIKPLNSIAN